MVSVVINIDDPERLHLFVRGKRREIEQGVKDVTREHTRMLQREIIRTMLEDPKTGRVYYRGGGRLHQASAPGESPAVDTGALVASIRMTIGDGGLEGIAFTRSPYAGYLENGTRDKKILPRPAFVPSLAKVRQSYLDAIKKVVEGR